MKRLLFHFLFNLILLNGVWAQTYPVQTNVQITAPYSTFLSDYVAVGSNRFIVNAFLADLARPQLQVRFRLSIEGADISLKTKPGYIGNPFLLTSGFPTQILGEDLTEYFMPEHLDLVGITETQLRRTGALPEGIYRFSVEVLEYNRGVQISNSATATAWLILNDPPVINLPYQNEVISANDPQTVRFQWTPRHTGSPNSAFTTNYEFKLVEIWPESRNPNDAILTSNPLYVTELTATSLIYGLGQPPLIPGRKYAFQIQARAATGIEVLDLFKNQGRSEVHSFTFGETCNPPTQITGQAVGNTKLRLNWEPSHFSSSVAVMYRESNEGGFFFEEDTYISNHTLSKLKQGKTYEVILRSQCGTLISEDSPPFFINTGNDATAFACGNLDLDFDLTNKDPIIELFSGNIIYAGDFEVKLDSVSGSKGKFSGGGVATFPFLNFVTARVAFKDVLVNTDFRMVDGNITSYYNPNSAMMADLDKEEPEINTTNDGNAQDSTASQPNLKDSTSTNYEVVDSIYTNESGQIILVANGKETEVDLAPGEEKTFTDAAGNTITVNENGVATTSAPSSTGAANGTNNSTEDGFTISIGPLVAHIKATEAPRSEDGKCYYDEVEVSFELLMADNTQQLDPKIKLDGGILSLVKDCETDEILSLEINWQDDEGFDMGKVAYLGVKVLDVHLAFTEDELTEGSVTLEVKNDSDVNLNPITVLRAGVSGQFKYQYEARSKDYTGTFDFGGISNVNIDILKGSKTIASLKDGEFNKEGWLKGHLDLVSPVTFKSGAMDVRFTKFKSDIEFSLAKGFNTTSGDIRFEVVIPNLQGSIKGKTLVENSQYTTELTANSLIAFGMTLSDLNLALNMDETLDFESISGTMKATHPEFGVALDVLNFEVKQGTLTAFSCAGSVAYDQLAIRINQANYQAGQQLLRLDGQVEQSVGGIVVAASVDDFTIDTEGNITMGDYAVDISGVRTFGPLTVALSATVEGEKKNKWISTVAEASFSLRPEGSSEEIQITRATINFEKKKGKEQYRNISIKLEDSHLATANIGPLQAYLTSAQLNIVHDGDYISGEPGDENNARIGANSYLAIRVQLLEDKHLGGLVYLDKGITGIVRFNFSGAGLGGKFAYGGIENINLSARKGDQTIAALRDGSLQDSGTLTGKLTALEGATFASGVAALTVNELELDVTVSFLSPQPSADILSGTGLLTLSQIKGMDGQFSIGLEYDDQDNFTASIQNNSEVAAMGMRLSSFAVNVELSPELDVRLIEGQMKANHDEFDAALIVNEFRIEAGELVSFNIEGKVNHKGFFLDISRALYQNEALRLDGKIAMNVTGTSAWLEVKEFGVSALGEVTIKKVAGEFDKSPVLVKFSAGLADSHFQGTFTGELASIGLAGKIDIGVESSQYNFAYLELTAKSNIPLGGTGLKLTKLGGQLGYNYVLKYNNSTTPEGQPQEGNYIIGLTLGVADIGDMAELTGNPVVQFGKSHLSMILNGNLKVPRFKPVLSGEMQVNYKLPDNTISGGVQAELNVPPQSGKAFRGQFDMDFNVAASEWSVSSSQISASLLEKIDFNGNIDLKGKTGTENISGYLSGVSSYEFSKDYEFSMFSFDFKASVDAGFNFQGRINFSDTGLDGKAQIYVYVNGELGVTTSMLGYSKLIELSGNMRSAVSFNNTSATLEGKLTMKVNVFGNERSVDVNIIQTI